MLGADYLGDGVYASYDGYHIVLDLRGQDDTTRIALEPAVFAALLRYKRTVDLDCERALAQSARQKG